MDVAPEATAPGITSLKIVARHGVRCLVRVRVRVRVRARVRVRVRVGVRVRVRVGPAARPSRLATPARLAPKQAPRNRPPVSLRGALV